MIEKLDESSGSVLGYKFSGTIKKGDYETMVSEVEAVVEGEGSVNLLLDLTDFKWEAVDAWGADGIPVLLIWPRNSSKKPGFSP